MRLLSVAAALAVAAVGLLAVPASAADPFGADSCAGVRPGAAIEDPAQNVYTMNFFFKGTKGKDTATFFGTVGDLVLTTAGQKVWKGSSGPPARDANGAQIGHFAYAFRTDTPNADSFALVRVNKGIRWSPGVCHFGGPTGVYTAMGSTPFVAGFYGQSLAFVGANLLPARSGIVQDAADKDSLAMIGPADAFATGLGDDGAPVVADGKALGFVGVAVSVGGEDGIQVRRIAPVVAKAAKATGYKFTLLTSKPL
jgi:hypothetical protein